MGGYKKKINSGSGVITDSCRNTHRALIRHKGMTVLLVPHVFGDAQGDERIKQYQKCITP